MSTLVKLELPPSTKMVARPPMGPVRARADAGLRGEKIGERNGLALLDFLTADEIDRSGSVVELERLSIGGDDDVFGNALNFETEIERVIFSQRPDRERSREVRTMDVENECGSGPAERRGDRRRRGWKLPTRLERLRALELGGDFDVADAVTGEIGQSSGEMGVGGIVLRLQGETDCENHEEKEKQFEEESFSWCPPLPLARELEGCPVR